MAILIMNLDDSELFLPAAFQELEAMLQGILTATPTACIENLKPKAGTVHFHYDGDKLISIYFKPCEETTS